MTDYDGLVFGLDEAEYHARPELSSTGARLLLEEFGGSPALFRHRMDNPQPGKRDYDVGHAAHTEVLGVGSGMVEYPDEHLTPSGNVSTKVATLAWAQEQRDNGLTPVSPEDMRAVNGMRDSILAHPKARQLLEQATEREVSVFADVEGVPSRARLDAMGDGIGIDLKTSRKTANATGFSRSSGDLGYHVQEGWYRDTLSACGIELDRFLFIVVEKTAPYLVGVNEHDVIFREMGKAAAGEARRRYRHGMETGEWPGYSTDIEYASPPAWMAMLYDDQYGTEMTQ